MQVDGTADEDTTVGAPSGVVGFEASNSVVEEIGNAEDETEVDKVKNEFDVEEADEGAEIYVVMLLEAMTDGDDESVTTGVRELLNIGAANGILCTRSVSPKKHEAEARKRVNVPLRSKPGLLIEQFYGLPPDYGLVLSSHNSVQFHRACITGDTFRNLTSRYSCLSSTL